METSDLDIVYCLRAFPPSQELKYSLRSLKNLPHREVWIYGGCPEWVDNVHHVPVIQNKGNKWRNTASLLEEICDNEEISENFIWFNDDFFVLKKTQELQYYHDRTLRSRVLDFSKISWRAVNNAYCTRLTMASRSLKFSNKDTLNYELHLPIIFNRYKLKEIIEKYPKVGAKRSLYGNNFVENSIQRDDVKIYDNEKVPDDTWDFLSTSDKSFREGEIGKWVKKKFNRRCKYEKSNQSI